VLPPAPNRGPDGGVQPDRGDPQGDREHHERADGLAADAGATTRTDSDSSGRPGPDSAQHRHRSQLERGRLFVFRREILG